MRIVPLALALVGLAGGVPAHADPNRAYVHDAGNFFLRLSGGAGYGDVSFDNSDETAAHGLGGFVSIGIGGTVARNIAIDADLFGMSLFEPTVSQHGDDLGNADNTSLSLFAVGVGGTFYIEPANLYFAASLGVGRGKVEASARVGGATFHFEQETDPGPAIDLMFGKEWWVGRRWGIGLALQSMIAFLKTEDGVDTTAFGIGVLFSATYN